MIDHSAPPRPIAEGREPCPYCGTRLTIGCRHFAPSGAEAPTFEDFVDGRTGPKPGNGFRFRMGRGRGK
jgi:hypothetical protein